MDGDEKALKRVEDGYATQLILGVMLLLFAWQTWSWWAIGWALLFGLLSKIAFYGWMWRVGSQDGADEVAELHEFNRAVTRAAMTRWLLFIVMMAIWGASAIETGPL